MLNETRSLKNRICFIEIVRKTQKYVDLGSASGAVHQGLIPSLVKLMART